MSYFFKKNQWLIDRNKLDSDIANYMKKYDHVLCESDDTFSHLLQEIKKECKTLNAKHTNVRKKLDPKIRKEKDHTYIWISDQLSYIAYKVSFIYSPF